MILSADKNGGAASGLGVRARPRQLGKGSGDDPGADGQDRGRDDEDENRRNGDGRELHGEG